MKSTPTRVMWAWRRSVTAASFLLAGLVLFFATRPLSAESSVADLDPVIADIVEMLDAGVDEGVILQWLESTGRRPLDIGSQGLVALTQAEASDDFVKVLLAKVEEPVREDSSSASQPPHVGSTTAMTLESARPQSQDPEEAVIRLRAKRVWVDEDEPDSPREPRWSVFLYLDGQLVSWTWPTRQGEPVEARRAIEAGRHEMRVVLQRYEELREGWFRESLSVPTQIDFESQGSVPLEIDVEMNRIWGLWRQRKDGGPLSFVIRQDDQVLAEDDGTGGDPNRWQPVCEDVEANFGGADTVPKRFRNSLSRCIRWADLWTGSGKATSRDEILRSLEEYDFQPPVR